MPWSNIYECLLKTWNDCEKSGPPPPKPLILNGWFFSNDFEKAERWNNTIEWIKRYGTDKLIPKLTEDQMYSVEQMDYNCPYWYSIGKKGRHYLPWNYDSKKIPSDEEVDSALNKLQQNWDFVAEKGLSEITKPLKFTGKKKRRLLVSADFNYNPPWGNWESLNPDESRRSFTRLRKAVNDMISPLMVDHIDFTSK